MRKLVSHGLFIFASKNNKTYTIMTDYDNIKALRDRGDYTAAYELCMTVKSNDPECLWVYNQIGLSISGILKNIADKDNADAFLTRLQEYADLNKERHIEQFVTNTLIWRIRSFVVTCISKDMVLEDLLYKVFAIMQQIDFDPKDENYGVLLGAFVKAKTWGGLKAFINWWDLNNIKDKDCESYRMDNGKSIMSVAEQAYIAYARILIAEAEAHTTDVDKALEYAYLLGTVANNHTDFQYPGYFQAKLLMAINRKDDARAALILFIKKHNNLYWVWDLMGDAQDDIDLRISCYCKALTCPVKDSFLRKLHFKLCDILLKKEMYNEAAAELRMAIEVSANNGWSVPYKYKDYTVEQWFKQAENSNNKEFYKRNTNLAEQLAYADYPQMEILVYRINKDKQVANFVTPDHKAGFFSCKSIKCRVGSTYICRMENDGGNHYKVYACEPTDGVEAGLIKEFSGILSIKQGGYGFVEDVFIPASMLKDFENNTFVSGKVGLSYEEKKDKWGWTALQLNH